MAIKHRLISNGVLITTTEFNEVDRPTIEIARDGIYAEEIDEVSFTPVPMRFARDKRILVIPGYFDEVTGILVSSTPQSVFVFPSTSIMGEGRYMSFAVSNLPEDGTYYWTILNNTTSDLDFSTTSGTFQSFGGVGSFQLRAALDRFTDGATELFRVEIREDSITGPVIGSSDLVSIFDNSTTEFGVFTESLEIEEDVNVTFIANSLLTTSTLYWTISHGSTVPTDFVATSGSFATTQGSGTFTVRLIKDFLTEGPETFSVQVRTGSTSGPIIATSVAIVAIDTSQAVNFDGNALTVIEGQPYTATFGNPTDIEIFWFTKLGHTGADYGTAVAVDVDDNIYISGSTLGSVPNNADNLVSKLTYTGTTSWQRQLGTNASEESANDIVITGLGDLATVGTVSDTDLGEVLQLLRVTTAGTLVWEYRPTFTSRGYSVDYYSDYFYVTGVENISNVDYITVIKVSRSSGRPQWIRRIGSSDQNIVANSISVSSTEKIAIVGTVSNLANTIHKIIVLSLDLAGNLLWQKEVSGLGNSYGNSIDTTSSKFYIIGTTEPAPGQSYIFLMRFSFDGTVEWQKLLGGTNNDVGTAIAVHSASSDILITGSSSENLLVARLTTEGNLVWQNKISNTGTVAGQDICINNDGNFQIVAQTYNTSDLYGILVTKLPSDGSLTGTYDQITYSTSALTLTNGSLSASTSLYALTNPGIIVPDYFFINEGTDAIIDSTNTNFYSSYNNRISKISWNQDPSVIWSKFIYFLPVGYTYFITNLVVDSAGYLFSGIDENDGIYLAKSDVNTGATIWVKLIVERPEDVFTTSDFGVVSLNQMKLDNNGNLRMLIEYSFRRNSNYSSREVRYYTISTSTGNILARTTLSLSGNTTPFTFTEFSFDSSGNSYLSGFVNPFVEYYYRSATVTKLNSSGSELWTATLKINPSNNYDNALDNKVDSLSNIYILVTTVLPGNTRVSAVLVKLDSSGNTIWYLVMGEARSTTIFGTFSGGSIEIDSTNNVYVSVDGDLLKVSPSGQIIWAKRITVPNSTSYFTFKRMKIDESENVLYLIDTAILSIPLDGSVNLRNQNVEVIDSSITSVLSTTSVGFVESNKFSDSTIGGSSTTTQTSTDSNTYVTGANFTVSPLYQNSVIPGVPTLTPRTYTINPVTGFIPNGTYYWTINHVTTTSADFVTNSGTLNVTNGATTVTVTTRQDYIQEGFRGFKIQLRTGSISGTVVFETPTIFIDDSDFIPSIVPNVTAINEGSAVTFTLSNIGPTGTYYWTSNSPDLTAANGTVLITNGAGTLTVTATGDLVTEGPETFAVSIRSSSITGSIIITSEEITINDTSVDVTLTVQTPSIIEGQNAILAVTNIFPNGTYYWSILHETTIASDFSATSGSFTSVANIASISITSVNDYIAEGARTFRVQIRTGSTSGSVVSLSDSITIDDTTIVPTLTYSSQVNEGSSITVSCSNIGPNGTYYWTSENTEDLTTSSGTVSILNGGGSFSVPALADFITEGDETFTVSLRSGSRVGPIIITSDLITIVDTSQSPTITFSANPINEGQVLTVFLSNVFPLTATLYWTLYPVTAERNEISASSGSIAVTNGNGSFTLSALNDFLTEGSEIFKIRLRRDSVTGPIIATSDEIVITDTSTTPVIELSSNEVMESGFLVVTVAMPISSGTFYWTVLNETTTNDDFYFTNSAFLVDNFQGSFEIPAFNEFITEVGETFRVQIRTNSVTGPVIVTSDSITLIDNNIDPPITGESVYTAPGTYTWVCPEDVYSVDAVAVGGGGGQTYYSTNPYPWGGGAGGGGGGLGWRTRIKVNPGQSYTVVVGQGGQGLSADLSPGNPSTSGTDSYFISPNIVKGGGGASGATSRQGGTYIGTGGGNGGNGGQTFNESGSAGGGGAGGYSGNGGNGSTSTFVNAGQGGSGAGGAIVDSFYSTGGGGVGIYGQGASGTGAGQSGSGGTNGTTSFLIASPVFPYSIGGSGGSYGGGGGTPRGGALPGGQTHGGFGYRSGGDGASGAVRIIWGPGRSFPNNAA